MICRLFANHHCVCLGCRQLGQPWWLAKGKPPHIFQISSGTWLWTISLFLLLLDSETRRAGLVQAVESYRLWPEGPVFESWSPRIAQARVRLATDTLPQTPHRAGALCTGYAIDLIHNWFNAPLVSGFQQCIICLFFIFLGKQTTSAYEPYA